MLGAADCASTFFGVDLFAVLFFGRLVGAKADGPAAAAVVFAADVPASSAGGGVVEAAPSIVWFSVVGSEGVGVDDDDEDIACKT